MSAPAVPAGALAPVAVVWCRQVDNEAESPGYTTIPEEFPGRRETLEAIRVIGNLTVNVADTHDYWDPDPSQPLSYYPNLFLYPAAAGRYTCVGRMFLSTEDRPRLGMKTLVFSTADLVASGEFGPAILRAHASMGGKSAPPRVAAEPDASVFQAVGEGFLFHRGSTEPVVLVAADQWEAACQVVLDLVRVLPTSLVALSAFLVFPYFLPEAKVNPHEFTEQVPLALAVMRVPKGEAQGDRHSKRINSWESAPVALRDLTKPPAKGKDALPLVLQYVRDHLDVKLTEVARRVDAVEGDRTRREIQDAEAQGGKDRRKDMWRIGTAMETAALLLAKPKGRSVPMTGEAAKRANLYLQAQPATAVAPREEAIPAPDPAPDPAAGPSPSQHPPWLQRPADIAVPAAAAAAVGVPMSISDDNTLHAAPPSSAKPAAAGTAAPVTAGAAVAVTDAELDARIRRILEQRLAEMPRSTADPAEAAARDARLLSEVDGKIRLAADQSARGLVGVQSDVAARIAAVESRPIVDPKAVSAEVERNLHAQIDPAIAGLTEQTHASIQSTAEVWAERLREELRQSINDLKVGTSRSEDELRLALAAQLEVELAETKEQGTALREEIESRVRELLKTRTGELEQQRVRDLREVEQRLGLLIDGRTKDVETRVRAALVELQTRNAAALDPRFDQLEVRLGGQIEARAKEIETRLRSALNEQPALAAATVDPRVDAAERRLTALVEGRVKDAEARLRLALNEQQSKSAATVDPRIEAAEKRLAELIDGRAKDVEARLRLALNEQHAKNAANLDPRIEGVEKRLAILVDSRSKELEGRLRAAQTEQLTRGAQSLDERLDGAEKRLGVEREARLSELAESQTQALAGLQVRLQAYIEQKLHENQDREREKYVELLARLRTEVDQAIQKSVDPLRLDAAIRDRIAPQLEVARETQELAAGKAISEAETRLRAQQDDSVVRVEAVESQLEQREAELQRIERSLRTDVEDLDRRIQVLSDRVIPLLRRTWMKVGDLEKGPPLTEEMETRFKDLRREMVRELRRMEGELLEQTNDLRDRLEGTVAHQGRIWLNLLKQLSAENDELSADLVTGPRPASRPSRAARSMSDDEFFASDLGTPVAYAPVDADPPNPIAPTSGGDDPRDSRRRSRRS